MKRISSESPGNAKCLLTKGKPSSRSRLCFAFEAYAVVVADDLDLVEVEGVDLVEVLVVVVPDGDAGW